MRTWKFIVIGNDWEFGGNRHGTLKSEMKFQTPFLHKKIGPPSCILSHPIGCMKFLFVKTIHRLIQFHTWDMTMVQFNFISINVVVVNMTLKTTWTWNMYILFGLVKILYSPKWELSHKEYLSIPNSTKLKNGLGKSITNLWEKKYIDQLLPKICNVHLHHGGHRS